MILTFYENYMKLIQRFKHNGLFLKLKNKENGKPEFY